MEKKIEAILLDYLGSAYKVLVDSLVKETISNQEAQDLLEVNTKLYAKRIAKKIQEGSL